MLKTLSLILIIIALTAFGSVAGYFMRPALPDDAESQDLIISQMGEIIKFQEPFIVPVIKGGKVEGVVILGLAVEIPPNFKLAFSTQEAKLRDAILTTLFNYSNAGYFSGIFTEERKITLLRHSITESINKATPHVSIIRTIMTDIVRQDKYFN